MSRSAWRRDWTCSIRPCARNVRAATMRSFVVRAEHSRELCDRDATTALRRPGKLLRKEIPEGDTGLKRGTLRCDRGAAESLPEQFLTETTDVCAQHATQLIQRQGFKPLLSEPVVHYTRPVLANDPMISRTASMKSPWTSALLLACAVALLASGAIVARGAQLHPPTVVTGLSP